MTDIILGIIAFLILIGLTTYIGMRLQEWFLS